MLSRGSVCSRSDEHAAESSAAAFSVHFLGRVAFCAIPRQTTGRLLARPNSRAHLPWRTARLPFPQ